MQQKKLTLRVHDEEVTFYVLEAMKYPSNYNKCHYIDIIEKVTTEVFENETPALPLEACLIHPSTINEDDFKRRECANYLEATTSLPKYGRQQIKELGVSTIPAPPSILDAPKLELKELPQHLRYAFLGENSTLPVIVSSSLTGDGKEKLLRATRS